MRNVFFFPRGFSRETTGNGERERELPTAWKAVGEEFRKLMSSPISGPTWAASCWATSIDNVNKFPIGWVQLDCLGPGLYRTIDKLIQPIQVNKNK